jgi:hypothetical protein
VGDSIDRWRAIHPWLGTFLTPFVLFSLFIAWQDYTFVGLPGWRRDPASRPSATALFSVGAAVSVSVALFCVTTAPWWVVYSLRNRALRHFPDPGYRLRANAWRTAHPTAAWVLGWGPIAWVMLISTGMIVLVESSQPWQLPISQLLLLGFFGLMALAGWLMTWSNQNPHAHGRLARRGGFPKRSTAARGQFRTLWPLLLLAAVPFALVRISLPARWHDMLLTALLATAVFVATMIVGQRLFDAALRRHPVWQERHPTLVAWSSELLPFTLCMTGFALIFGLSWMHAWPSTWILLSGYAGNTFRVVRKRRTLAERDLGI